MTVAIRSPLLEGLEALLDRILMRTREGRKDEFPNVRVSRMNRQSSTFRHGIHDGEHVGEIELWGDTLRVEVEREGDDVYVSGTFTVAEDCTLDSVGTGEDTEFSGSNGTSCRNKER